MEGKVAHTSVVKPLLGSSNNKILLGILVLAIVLGVVSGYFLAKKSVAVPGLKSSQPTTAGVSAAQQDTQTFKDFAEGTIKAKPQGDASQYAEGTHLLERDGAPPVALTSSVVDLSKYEGKKVKVYGETQKALSEGWLMDVGKVDVE